VAEEDIDIFVKKVAEHNSESLLRPGRGVHRVGPGALQHIIFLLLVDFVGRAEEELDRQLEKDFAFGSEALFTGEEDNSEPGGVHEPQEMFFLDKQQFTGRQRTRLLSIRQALVLPLALIRGDPIKNNIKVNLGINETG
jgi:hypothetical protein